MGRNKFDPHFVRTGAQEVTVGKIAEDCPKAQVWDTQSGLEVIYPDGTHGYILTTGDVVLTGGKR